ncbi:MAG: wax ester/triacylglycerol synthase family O-acyltransferase [Acidimicrobiales bacterium]|nr:wax ester/triacylglycerol synthase family O-acyltransferase [Acidimicrobiales bacterium]
MKRLGGMDAMFLSCETPSMHLHVVGVLLLDPPQGPEADPRDALKRLVGERLALLAPFRWRLVQAPGAVAGPSWIEDPEFSLDNHIRFERLASPGDSEALEALIGDIAGVLLDRSKPLWEMTLVDGLDDGKVAVITKLHHALMDGSAGADIMAHLFDLTPEVRAPEGVDQWNSEQIPSTWKLIAAVPSGVFKRLSAIPGAVAGTVGGVRGFVGSAFPKVDGVRQFSGAPRTPYNDALTPRRVVSLETCSLSEVKQLKNALGVTVNDVVLAAVASAMRNGLLEIDGLPDRPMIAAVPVAERGDGEGGFGNQTSMMMVPLPTHIADPLERVQWVHEAAAQAKDSYKEMGSDFIESWAQVLPSWMVSVGSRAWGTLGLAKRVPPVCNVVVSNVPGPPIPLYMAGARVAATFPLGPLLEGVGVNITVLSQDDDLHVGVIACPDIVSNSDAIAAGVGAEIAELLEAVEAAG